MAVGVLRYSNFSGSADLGYGQNRQKIIHGVAKIFHLYENIGSRGGMGSYVFFEALI